jgi:hypothetical protein
MKSGLGFLYSYVYKAHSRPSYSKDAHNLFYFLGYTMKVTATMSVGHNPFRPGANLGVKG